MKNSKGKGAAGLLILLAALVGFIYLAYLTVSQNKIKLGLDLAGGVSITYQTVDPNPSDQDMRDTIYKLQQRVGSYSDEAQVYQEGTNRINIDIPGVSDANTILEELGKPGSLQFIEPDGTVILTGDQVKSAQAGQMQDRTT
ncbi:MAG: protein translocase subunit SecDF, partial [Stomatobaculum sp.]|nr:protein translocase subunit SecDF [Stomatobaculum sp.]